MLKKKIIWFFFQRLKPKKFFFGLKENVLAWVRVRIESSQWQKQREAIRFEQFLEASTNNGELTQWRKKLFFPGNVLCESLWIKTLTMLHFSQIKKVLIFALFALILMFVSRRIDAKLCLTFAQVSEAIKKVFNYLMPSKQKDLHPFRAIWKASSDCSPQYFKYLVVPQLAASRKQYNSWRILGI
jgi:hypothetical protein